LVRQPAVTAMDGLQLPLVQIVLVRQPTKTIGVERSGLQEPILLGRLRIKMIAVERLVLPEPTTSVRQLIPTIAVGSLLLVELTALERQPAQTARDRILCDLVLPKSLLPK
jgi:hypothetical protein